MVLKRCVGRALVSARQAEAEGRLAETLRITDAVLTDFPLRIDARLIRARVWARTGRLPGAEEEIRGILKNDPRHVEAQLALIGILLLTGRNSEAVDSLAKVTRQCAQERGEMWQEEQMVDTIGIDQVDAVYMQRSPAFGVNPVPYRLPYGSDIAVD